MQVFQQLDSRPHLAMLASAVLASFLAGNNPSAQVTFEGLGDLPGSAFTSEARAVSADGTVVVGRGVSTLSWGGSSGDWEGALWRQGMIIPLGDLPGGDFFSYADDVSGDGQWIVGTSASKVTGWRYSRQRAAVWQPSGILLDLGDLPGITDVTTHAKAVNDDGSVIVGSSSGVPGDPTRKVAVRWLGVDVAFSLGWLEPDTESDAQDVSADGSVIVGTDSKSGYSQAWIWTGQTGMVGLGLGTSANAVSANGIYVLGRLSNGNAGRWSSAAGWVDLGGFTANGVSDDGQVVVGARNYPGGADAMLWSPAGTLRKIDTIVQNEWGSSLGGNLLNAAWDITPDGTTLVGHAKNPSGDREAFRLTLPRETWSELGGALSGTKGEPTLAGTGSFVAGTQVALDLTNVKNSTLAFMVIGKDRADLPFAGGVIVPSTNVVRAVNTGQSGRVTLTATWPGGQPGTEFYFQAWIVDPQGSGGYAASNALHAVVR